MFVLRFVLKLIVKILLLPVVILLAVLLGIVKMLTAVYGMFHGIAALFLGILCVATFLTYHDWVRTAFVAVLCGCSFLILTVGVMVETLLEEGLGAVWGIIAG